MIELELEIGSKKNKLPSGKIYMNDVLVHDGEYDRKIFNLQERLGDNKLSISLENKTDADTVLKGNQILEDVYVIVKGIKCAVTGDKIDQYDTFGEYITDKNENLKTYGYLSYNGVYTFNFQYPFFVFKKNKIFYQ